MNSNKNFNSKMSGFDLDCVKYMVPQADKLSSGSIQEIVFVTDFGQVVGDILLLNCRNKLQKKHAIHNANVRSMIESSSEGVGRIFVEYNTSKGGIQYFVGSAFAVTNNIIVTADHNVDAIREKDEVTFTLHRIFITFDPYTRFQEEVGIENMLELELLPKVVDSLDEFKSTPYELNSTFRRNDFRFLRFKNGEVSPTFLLPKHIPEETNCVVIGTPGSVDKTTFVNDHPSENSDELFEDLKERMDSFQRKTISSGSCEQTLEGFMLHRCPTLKGFSGGLVVILSKPMTYQYFSGIHIGGSMGINKNVFISVNRPEFAVEYALAIQNDTYFVAQNKNNLVDYFSTFSEETKNYANNLYKILFN
ncbi:hypothetical protein AKO1_000308 [Acrasis kona]|uniref:Serine protease n=1 Tax=Acrasis kona TaxID=1008807 RepID=A0AAW2YMI1_9EUKA